MQHAGCALKDRPAKAAVADSSSAQSKHTCRQHASASSIIKIWIVLTTSVNQHLPLPRHTSPLPPNAFSPPKHIPNTQLLLQKPAIYPHTAAASQPNKPLLCPAAGVSKSKYDVSPAGRPFPSFSSLSPIETQTQTLFLSSLAQRANLTSDFAFSESVEQLPGLYCLVHLQLTFFHDLPTFNGLSVELNICNHVRLSHNHPIKQPTTDSLNADDEGEYRSKCMLNCITAKAQS